MGTSKINYATFKRLMQYEVVQSKSCLEIEFCIDHDAEYNACWLGKADFNSSGKEIYWYGLVEDGSQAYEYPTFEALALDKVFHGKSLQEIWNSVSIYSINGLSVDAILPFYLKPENLKPDAE